MYRNVMVVHTNASLGREDEFNEWYDSVHIPEVLAIPGFVGAQRFVCESVSLPGETEDRASTYKYLAIYDVSGDPQEAMNALAAARGDLHMSSALADERQAFMYVPLGERKTVE